MRLRQENKVPEGFGLHEGYNNSLRIFVARDGDDIPVASWGIYALGLTSGKYYVWFTAMRKLRISEIKMMREGLDKWNKVYGTLFATGRQDEERWMTLLGFEGLNEYTADLRWYKRTN